MADKRVLDPVSPRLHKRQAYNRAQTRRKSNRLIVCPDCDSSEVRPSHLMNPIDKALSLLFISPYRCKKGGGAVLENKLKHYAFLFRLPRS